MSKKTYLEKTAPKSFDFDASLRAAAAKLMALMEFASDATDVSKLAAALASIEARVTNRGRAHRRQLDEYAVDDIVANLLTRSERDRQAVVRALTGGGKDEPLL